MVRYNQIKKERAFLPVAWALLAATAMAESHAGGDSDAREQEAPLYQGVYVAPLMSYTSSSGRLGDGYGVSLGVGHRLGWYAMEMSLLTSSMSSRHNGDVQVQGGSIDGLIFPSTSWPGIYGRMGFGGLDFGDYPTTGGQAEQFGAMTLLGGIGALWPLNWGAYEFAVRTEALYRYGKRERSVRPAGDIDAQEQFEDVVFSMGLQLPLGRRAAEPEPERVRVVGEGCPAAKEAAAGASDSGCGVMVGTD